MKYTVFIFFLLSQIVYSQNLYVSTNKKILSSDSKYYFPVLSPDGNKVIFTTENYKGLFIFDINHNKQRTISSKQGAGYHPLFSKDGSKIYYRLNEYKGIKKYSSLFEMNLKNNQINIIESKKRDLSPPEISGNNLVYTVQGRLKKTVISNSPESRNDLENWTKIENQKIVVFINGKKKFLAPNGNGNYIWPQLSPDKTKILFTFAGHGTYICDLDGNILKDLGYLNASKWLNDDWVVGMKDYDNGNFVTDSDIYAVNINNAQPIALTNTKDEIEMYPDCSGDGSKIVYHTLDGDIYLMTVKLTK